MKLDNLPSIDPNEEPRPRNAEDAAPQTAAPAPSAPAQQAAPVTPAGTHGAAGQPSIHPAQAAPSSAPKSKSRVKYIAAAICLLAAIGAGTALAAAFAEKQPEPAAEPEVIAPETVQATVKADGVLIEGPVLDRDDVITSVAPADELTGAHAGKYYRAVVNGKTVYVEKSAVRTSEETAPEEWTGYAAEGAIIFANPDFTGDDILTLQLNEEVTVLDAFGDLLFVRNADGFEGYMPADMVLREPAPEPEPEPDVTYTYTEPDYSYSGGQTWTPPSGGGSSSGGGSTSGSGGGGSTGGGDAGGSSSGGGSTQGDGDDMAMPVAFIPSTNMFLPGVEMAYADEPSADTSSSAAATAADGVTATVLADGTKTYLGILNRGDEVTVKVDDLLGPAQAQNEAASSSDAAAANGQGSSEEGATSENADEEGAESSTATESGNGPRGASDEETRVDAAEAEDLCTVIVNDAEITLPEKLLRFTDDAPFEAWTGFAMKDAVLYADWKLESSAHELAVNDQVAVIDAIGNTLVVEREDGIFYIDAAFVSREEVEVEPEPEPEPAAEAPVVNHTDNSWSGGGSTWTPPSAGGGSGGGQTSTPAPEPDNPSGSGGGNGGTTTPSDEQDWTPPQL